MSRARGDHPSHGHRPPSRSAQFLQLALEELYRRAGEDEVPVDRWVMIACDLDGESIDAADEFGKVLRSAAPWAPVQARIDTGRIVLLARDWAAGATSQAALVAAGSHLGRVRISLHALPSDLEAAWEVVVGRRAFRRADLPFSDER